MRTRGLKKINNIYKKNVSGKWLQVTQRQVKAPKRLQSLDQYKKKNMNELINNDDKYTIIATQFQYGQLLKTIEKENVRNECEKIRKLYEFSAKNNDNKTYSRIEVVNNATGEIREYWNSEEKQTLF